MDQYPRYDPYRSKEIVMQSCRIRANEDDLVFYEGRVKVPMVHVHEGECRECIFPRKEIYEHLVPVCARKGNELVFPRVKLQEFVVFYGRLVRFGSNSFRDVERGAEGGERKTFVPVAIGRPDYGAYGIHEVVYGVHQRLEIPDSPRMFSERIVRKKYVFGFPITRI